MEKRGAAHIEMVLSFIIFVSAVAFALYFFNPARTDVLVDRSLDYLFREIQENTSVELQTLSVVIHNDTIRLDEEIKHREIDTIAINITGILPATSGVKVFTLAGDEFPARRERVSRHGREEYEMLYVKSPLDTDWNETTFIYIYLSDEFSPASGIRQVKHNDSFYELGASNLRTLISENKMLALNSTYYTNYRALKRYFNIPDRVDFGFALVFSPSEQILAQRSERPRGEVFSRRKRVEVLRTDGQTAFADLIVRVW
ncbi:hypothetical protein D6817_01085 [Candidatus Pacearchaeota archaeon]|nr:MAG: hypothetical protein D6817_01085 [Candidatus Pacearchaeota archaeon]